MSLTTNKVEKKYGKIGMILAAALMASSSCIHAADAKAAEVEDEDEDEEEEAETKAVKPAAAAVKSAKAAAQTRWGWVKERKGTFAASTITSCLVGAGIMYGVAKCKKWDLSK